MRILNGTPCCQAKTDRPLGDGDRLPKRGVSLRHGYYAVRRDPWVISDRYGRALPESEQTTHRDLMAAIEWSEAHGEEVGTYYTPKVVENRIRIAEAPRSALVAPQPSFLTRLLDRARAALTAARSGRDDRRAS